jgi:predicted dithiol-disulfide oxidoreductase (DUF899 family)
METHKIVSRDEWVEARMQHLKQEKELTRLRDELSAQRRDLPWVRVDKDYVFEGSDGKIGLPELFGDKSQLIVQHFMFGPDWDAGCKSCSFWADNFNGIVVHLQQRDIAFVVVSQAPFGRIEEYRKRMGYGILRFDLSSKVVATVKPAAMLSNCPHPARMVLGPGGL